MVWIEAVVDEMDFAIPTNQNRSRHVFEIELLRDGASRIEQDFERRIVVTQEVFRIAAIVIDIDGKHDEAVGGVALLKFVHPRKGLVARIAPRRPEIEIDNLALVSAEVEVGCNGGVSSETEARRQYQ